jgi:hypothetical protein
MQSLFYSAADLFGSYTPRLIGVLVVLTLVALFYGIRMVIRRPNRARHARNARKVPWWNNLHILM